MKWNEAKLSKLMFTDEKLIWGLETQVEDPDLGGRWFKRGVYFTDSRLLWNVDTIKPESIPYESMRTIGKEGQGSGGVAGVRTHMKGGGVINIGSTYGDASIQFPDVDSLNYGLWLLNEVQKGNPLSPAEGVPDIRGQLDRNAPPPLPKKKGGCFVATAAFGSPSVYEVVILRNFRDQILTRNLMGRAFVSVYYTVSPPLAALIEKSGAARSLCRTLLGPIVLLADKLLRL